MADVIARFKADSSDYESKLKRASASLLDMAENAKRTGASLAYASKDELAFVRSLGQADTVAKGTRGQLRELTQAASDLQAHFQSLDRATQNSQYGDNLRQSINDLIQRAGDLRDTMDDTNEAIKHAASDTQFTDGVNMMTQSIGACASVMATWGGEGKEMEEVIKELAKIQATVGAVETLTKAFQKQNMVLMKNPYVAVAAAAVSLAVAIKKAIDRQREQEEAMYHTKEMAEQTKNAYEKIGSSTGELIGKYEEMRVEWKSLSTDQERNEWLEDNRSKMEEFGWSIDDVNDADLFFVKQTKAVVNALKARAKATAMQQLYTEQMKQVYEKAAADFHVEYVAAGQDVSAVGTNIKNLKEGVDYIKSEYQKIENGVIRTVVNQTLTQAGAQKINNQRQANAKVAMNSAIATGERSVENIYGQMLEKALNEQKAAEAIVDELLGKREEKKAARQISGRRGSSGSGSIQSKPKDGSIDFYQALVTEYGRNWSAATTDEGRAKWKGLQEEAQRMVDMLMGKAQKAAEESAQIETYMTGSFAAANQRLQEANQEMEQVAVGTERWNVALEQANDAKEELADLNALQNLYKMVQKLGIDVDMSGFFSQIAEGANVDDWDWESLVAEINEKLKDLKLDPIDLDVSTGNINTLEKAGTEAKGSWKDAANAICQVGGALQQIENPAMKIAGIVAEAVASIALSFARSLKDGKMEGGVWGWIAAAAAGTATMISTISAIKSATSGSYATGGIIPGNSVSGDMVPAMVNSGELILNKAQQGVLASQLSGASRMNVNVTGRISGRDILLAADADNRSRGGSRGVYSRIK